MTIIKIEGFGAEQRELLSIAFKIRSTVFVEEQGVDKFLEYDGLDDKAVHYLLYFNEKPAATARWRETEKGIKLERFAVLKEYRNKSFGALLLKYIMDEIIPSKKKIYLHAQINAVNFYKNNGFIIEGEKFTEAEIEHFVMTYPRTKL